MKALCLLGRESWVAPGSVGGDKVPPCPTPRLQTQMCCQLVNPCCAVASPNWGSLHPEGLPAWAYTVVSGSCPVTSTKEWFRLLNCQWWEGRDSCCPEIRAFTVPS